ncbi:hypothetical protein HJG54_21570 [Leptolyngbya sp. NK1-12]|uniref:Uncharacterized protein n=1 Tax=Leptolyngbya sp. NK1-12 TaxID=2547451 RepID=A0AA97AI50_9CYAN|nr:hypothetical protein [Leptolyngbya sp. NK1-12]WNZ25184.1 hypothetical protein HJG54_21570 [Leptolyngbya sp. NK1-12]
MKYPIWLLLLGCVSCSSPTLSQTPTSAPSPISPAQLTQAAPVPAAPVANSSLAQVVSPPANQVDRATIQQDYAATTPLPTTGRVTVRDHIRNLDPSRLIVNCPADSAPYAFAESSNYEIQICSEEYDPWQPKYYISQAKDRSSGLRITSANPEEARQLVFRNQGYTYVIYRDGARPDQINAYLEVYGPNGDSFAEALLYLYEAGPAPTAGSSWLR